MQKAVILDIDGTLSNCDHRQHLVIGEKKDFESFYKAMGDDEPNKWCFDLAHAMWLSGYSILFVTGRPDRYRGLTLNWIEETRKALHIEFEYELFMRPAEKEKETDYIVKGEIYNTLIKDRFDIAFVVEDRQQMVDYWRSIGLTALQCAKGAY